MKRSLLLMVGVVFDEGDCVGWASPKAYVELSLAMEA